MTSLFPRRALAGLALSAALFGLAAPASAQTPPTFRLNAVYGDKDIRAEAFRAFAKEVAADVTIEPHYNSTLFRQGTELVALQRGNLEMAVLAPADVSKQIPEWTLLTSAYLFRDANHLLAFFRSDLGGQWVKSAEDKLGVKILGPVYYGTRQVGLKPKTRINTPADLAGIKLRMPPGDAWQLLGRALGANPTPLAFGEVYTGLLTGAIDGQDNPLPLVRTAKFNEVMSQVVLTSHWLGYDLAVMSGKAWSGLDAGKQARLQAAIGKALQQSVDEHLKMEASLAADFKAAGLEVYTPDIAAFRAHAQKIYLDSPEAKSWPQGMIERIAAIQ